MAQLSNARYISPPWTRKRYTYTQRERKELEKEIKFQQIHD